MKTEIVPITEIKLNPDNPRIIKDEKFKKLVQSIKDFPRMMEIRPIVVNDDMIVLGGNMRLKACQEIGLTELPVLKASDLTPEQQKEFIIKDNVGFGDWDWEELTDMFDVSDLENWGLDMPEDEIKKTKDIPETGSVEFSEELLLEHNYIVLYFDNTLDWEVAKERFGLKQVKDLIPRKGQPTGIGRVLNGKNFI